MNLTEGNVETLSRYDLVVVNGANSDVSRAAEARITDVDVADNSAALVRNQILQPAASAILAQAKEARAGSYAAPRLIQPT